MQDNVEYLGQVVSKHGIHKSKGKLEAILKMSPPSSQKNLRSFLGIVNHYMKFIPFLANLSAPMNKLLKKDAQFYWSSGCEDSFNKTKKALTSTEVLVHFDPQVPLGLACDASSGNRSCSVPHI